jgi:hypothetical protein
MDINIFLKFYVKLGKFWLELYPEHKLNKHGWSTTSSALLPRIRDASGRWDPRVPPTLKTPGKNNRRVWVPTLDSCITPAAGRSPLRVADVPWAIWAIKVTLFGGLHRVFPAPWRFDLCPFGRLDLRLCSSQAASLLFGCNPEFASAYLLPLVVRLPEINSASNNRITVQANLALIIVQTLS